MSGIRPSILATIGDTPVVRINNLAPEGAELFVKLEAFNPLGSLKDRIALGMVEAAERDGRLRPGQTVIEATSGNTGIGLALVCAQKGYPLVVVVAESFSAAQAAAISRSEGRPPPTRAAACSPRLPNWRRRTEGSSERRLKGRSRRADFRR